MCTNITLFVKIIIWAIIMLFIPNSVTFLFKVNNFQIMFKVNLYSMVKYLKSKKISIENQQL